MRDSQVHTIIQSAEAELETVKERIKRSAPNDGIHNNAKRLIQDHEEKVTRARVLLADTYEAKLLERDARRR